MDGKARELYKKYITEKLNQVFSDIDTKEYPNGLRAHINFIKPKKLDGYQSEKDKLPDELSERFSEVDHFYKGIAAVKKNGKYNYINLKGELLSNEWFDKAWGFCRTVYNPGDFSHVQHVSYDLAKVQKNGKYNLINRDGKLVSDIWYDNIDNFIYDTAIVMKNGKYNIVNNKGELLSNMWFDEIFKSAGFAFGIIDRKHYVIDNDGQTFFAEWLDSRDIDKIKMYPNFLNINGTIICKKTEMENYNIKKGLFGYKCTNSVDTYNTKYKPIKKYGFKYTLCFDGIDLYLHDRMTNENLLLGKYSDIMYDDNFIIDNKNKKVYLIYENSFVDITDYYIEHLADKYKINIKSGIAGVISFDDFYNKEFYEIHSEVSEERRQEKKQKEQEQKTKIEIQKEKEKEEKIAQVEDLKNFENDERVRALNMLKEALMLLKKLPSSDAKITIDDIFIHNGDHLELLPTFKDTLKFIDLSDVSFENVDVHGLDFRGCNLGSSFKPQEVYRANLSGCNFDKVFFSPFTDFTGVDIRGCHFSEDGNPKTIDVFNVTFKDAIYDETTTYNGISFVEILNKKNKPGRRG